jgi:hypothetical protein
MNDTLLADRRDLVVERLSAEYAAGAFEVEELERRLSLVHVAKSDAELDALVTDLTPSPSLALVPAQRMRIAFGSIERTGPWTVPQELRARVLCGNLELDLREARLAPGVTTIEVDITMGNVEVVVPPGVEVAVEASSFLGNVEERTNRAEAPGTSMVRIVGRVKLGNLEVSTLRLGETHRDARWRRRDERRFRRAQRRMARHYRRCGEVW